MNRHKTKSNALSIGMGFVIALVSVVASADNSDPNNGKRKFTIMCSTDEDGGYDCTVLGRNNRKADVELPAGTDPPGYDAAKDKPLVSITVAEVPFNPGHPKADHADDKKKIMNTAGPHCWVQVGGKWSMIHC